MASRARTAIYIQPDSAIPSVINDPYNLWDTDGHEPDAIDINNWADTHN
jgi:hypothetical protein